MRFTFFRTSAIVLTLIYTLSTPVFASGAINNVPTLTTTLYSLTLVLLLAKVASLIGKIGLPWVIGEITVGIVLGNLRLFDIHFFDNIAKNPHLLFLSELGVIILLFEIGLESNIARMAKVGFSSLFVAIIGVLTPFILGVTLIPFLLPHLHPYTYIFLAATLTASSVGITARVLKDNDAMQEQESRIVLGAAVIADVFGLILLAILSSLVVSNNISTYAILFISGKALGFLLGSIILGVLLAPLVGKILSAINPGIGMKLTLALTFCFLFSAIAQSMGLASIVGAFAAGLVLDPVHFKSFKDHKMIQCVHDALDEKKEPSMAQKIRTILHKYSERHVGDLLEPIGHFLTPLFFVMTGMNVHVGYLLQTKIFLVALVITIIAIIGKLVAGLVAQNLRKAIIGWGMVPRGEVGLIFATTGRELGVINDELLAMIVVVILFTTLITPPFLQRALHKK